MLFPARGARGGVDTGAVAVGEAEDTAAAEGDREEVGSGGGKVGVTGLQLGSAGTIGAEAAGPISGGRGGGTDPDLAARAISARRTMKPTDRPGGREVATDSESREEMTESLARRFTRDVGGAPERRRF